MLIQLIGEDKDLIGPILAAKTFEQAIQCMDFCFLHVSCAQYVFSEVSGLCKLHTGGATMTGPSIGNSTYSVDALWKNNA